MTEQISSTMPMPASLRRAVHQKLGVAGKKLWSFARNSYDRARSLDGSFADILLNRGRTSAAARNFVDALACYERVIKIMPSNAVALYQRAIVLRHLNRSDEALASLDRAITLKPDFADALISKAIALRLRNQILEALKCFREAMRVRPDDPVLHSTIIFTLNFDPSLSEADKQRERAEWDKRHAQKFKPLWKQHDNDPDPERRLRIGYISRYFRHDNAAYGFGNVILHHDSDRFEIYCYSDTEQEDDATAQLRDRSDHFVRTRQLSDHQLAVLIRQHGIDILVDCVGHMTGNRLLVFARKPAPIQVTAWGEPTGTGLEAMDYLFASPVLVPKSDRALFAEQVIDFSNFTGFWSPDRLPDVATLPALNRGYVTFGSFNRAVKLNDPTIRCWATILRRLPQARLVLKHPQFSDPALRTRIAAAFEAQGVPSSALTFLGGTDRQAHFACYNTIDIALDTFPHAGGMTTLDALWMGVPVITLPSKSVSSRWAATSLVPLGLSDFIADSMETYIELAVSKATDLESLSRLRATLRSRVANSDFGDGPRYCQQIEAAYVDIWRRWCQQRGRGPNDAMVANLGS